MPIEAVPNHPERVSEVAVQGPVSASRARPRVLLASSGNDYNLALYGCMPAGALDVLGVGSLLPIREARNLISQLGSADFFHVHWPEHLFVPLGGALEDYWERLEEFLDALRDSRVRLVMSMHNRRPHRLPAALGEELYRRWISRVDLALHHSRGGRDLMVSQYPFRSGCRHEVLPHPHFGLQMDTTGNRPTMEGALGLPACGIRLGLLGRFQPEKQIEMLLRAFGKAGRPDQQILLTAWEPGMKLPPDPRVFIPPRPAMMSRASIGRHLALCDALLVAPSGGSYLTSGLPGDALAVPIPMLAPARGYFEEILGPAGIYHDNTEAGISELLANLEAAQLASAQAAARRIQPDFDPRRLARRLADLLNEHLAGPT